MFANQSRKRPTIAAAKLSSLIAADLELQGDLQFAGGLRLDGRVVGNLMVADPQDAGRSGLLVIAETGRVHGSVRCADAVINGSVTGELWVENYLELQPKARVQGTIHYRQLRVETGAVIEGQLVQIEPVPREIVRLEAEVQAIGA